MIKLEIVLAAFRASPLRDISFVCLWRLTHPSGLLQLLLSDFELLHHYLEDFKHFIEHEDNTVIGPEACTATQLIWRLMSDVLDLLDNSGECIALE